jgi:hypothetical protein
MQHITNKHDMYIGHSSMVWITVSMLSYVAFFLLEEPWQVLDEDSRRFREASRQQ